MLNAINPSSMELFSVCGALQDRRGSICIAPSMVIGMQSRRRVLARPGAAEIIGSEAGQVRV